MVEVYVGELFKSVVNVIRFLSYSLSFFLTTDFKEWLWLSFMQYFSLKLFVLLRTNLLKQTKNKKQTCFLEYTFNRTKINF
jgi:hypothetical protein